MKNLSVAVFAAASAIFVSATSHAAGDGELYLDPQQSFVAPAQVFDVDVVAVPPDDTLVVWVVEVHFDPGVVAFVSCDPLDVPPGFISVTDCVVKDSGGGPEDDTFVTLGAALDQATELGISETVVLATITFQAVGDNGDHSDLQFEVVDFLGPDPDAPPLNPSVTDGDVEVTGDPPPTPTPSPSPSPPATPTPVPTPIPVGGFVELTTSSGASGSNMPDAILVAGALIVTVLAISLTRHGQA